MDCDACLSGFRTIHKEKLCIDPHPLERLIKGSDKVIDNFPFIWLMSKLLPPHNKFKGCELVFPDTAFFKENGSGAATIIIRNDKDFCLTST
jgi:hypothetical protein